MGPSLVSAWSDHRLGDAAVGVEAPAAETVTDEPGKAIVVLGDFLELAVPSALPARVTDRALPGDATGGHDVRAMAVRSEAPAALAAVAANTDADLVKPVRLGAGGNEVFTAALVGGEDLVSVKLENAEPAEDVSGSRFGVGRVRGCARLLVDHRCTSDGPGLGVLAHRRGIYVV